ncbi:hypothetical protein ACIP79_40745 [Streptomyces sp. NPDC088747]|uniref:hypothetical protein n=1 Tax=Streptomyces sp. NPDC088747 TaxID=3365886 RepID=UPI00380E212B
MTPPPTPPAPHGEQPGGAGGRLRSLNERQQTYLEVLFTIDQDNEIAQKRRWHTTGERQPAEQWRWITYGVDHPMADATPVQQQLGRRHVLDAGAGATLAALQRRGLIEVRRVTQDSPTGPIRHTQLRLTRSGRAAGRALRPEPAEQTTDSSLLPPWLQAALETVATAPGQTLAKIAIGRVGARRLGPGGHGYIEDASAWQYRLTPAGRAYLASHANRAAGEGI